MQGTGPLSELAYKSILRAKPSETVQTAFVQDDGHTVRATRRGGKQYRFDGLLWDKAHTNAHAWEMIRESVDMVIKGVISTLNILPIGSSGSGKSHTMNGGFTKTKGANWDEGIAPRVIRYAFAAWESEPDWKYHSTVDLCGHQKGRVASNVNGIIEWTQVTSATDLIGAFRAACNSRKTETTERNKSSSRSSLMFEMVSQRIIEGRADRAQRHQASGRSFTFFDIPGKELRCAATTSSHIIAAYNAFMFRVYTLADRKPHPMDKEKELRKYPGMRELCRRMELGTPFVNIVCFDPCNTNQSVELATLDLGRRLRTITIGSAAMTTTAVDGVVSTFSSPGQETFEEMKAIIAEQKAELTRLRSIAAGAPPREVCNDPYTTPLGRLVPNDAFALYDDNQFDNDVDTTHLQKAPSETGLEDSNDTFWFKQEDRQHGHSSPGIHALKDRIYDLRCVVNAVFPDDPWVVEACGTDGAIAALRAAEHLRSEYDTAKKALCDLVDGLNAST